MFTRIANARHVLLAVALSATAGVAVPVTTASAAPVPQAASSNCPMQMLTSPSWTQRADIADSDPTGRHQVGDAYDTTYTTHLLRWTNGVPQDLGTAHTGASGVNTQGDVVGTITTGDDPAGTGWRYHEGEFSPLPGLTAQAESYPSAINADGAVAGVSSLGSITVPVVWSTDGSVRRLALLPGDTSGWANDIDDDGTLVGFSSGASGEHAVRWLPDGTVERLQEVNPAHSSTAVAIRNGSVLGQDIPGIGVTSSLLWRAGATDPEQLSNGTPQVVNARGAVVELTVPDAKLRLTEPDGTVRSLPTDTTPYATGGVTALTDDGVAYGHWNSTPVSWDCRPPVSAP
ncbi:hypothetical protein [Streptomyces atroolivaceus]|uniref:hypothetical protein n=1 Tax=Streptomyces atroolivaceus TaxID=66869 RepID=UPI00363A5CB7